MFKCRGFGKEVCVCVCMGEGGGAGVDGGLNRIRGKLFKYLHM